MSECPNCGQNVHEHGDCMNECNKRGFVNPSDFKVQVQADSTGTWAGNGKVFDTQGAAAEYARDLFSRWTAVREWRVVKISTNMVAVGVGHGQPATNNVGDK